MDRKEKPRPARQSPYSNSAEVSETDAAALESPTGREDHLGLTEARRVAGSEIKKPIGATPRSEVTGRHDDGTGANETADGLTATEEAIRRAAEDTPSGRRAKDDMPVFDRGEAPPKV